MPQHLRDILLAGMRKKTLSWSRDTTYMENAFSDALFHRTRSRFRFTRKVRSAVVELFAAALYELGAEEDPAIIAERFLARGYVDGFYDEEDTRLARKGGR